MHKVDGIEIQPVPSSCLQSVVGFRMLIFAETKGVTETKAFSRNCVNLANPVILRGCVRNGSTQFKRACSFSLKVLKVLSPARLVDISQSDARICQQIQYFLRRQLWRRSICWPILPTAIHYENLLFCRHDTSRNEARPVEASNYGSYISSCHQPS
jgi:hypothetical protein